MNNGVNNNVQDNNTTGGLAPMAGVRIAPAEEGPVNASTGRPDQAAHQVPHQIQTPVVQQPVITTPVIEQPTIQPEIQQLPQPKPVITPQTTEPQIIESIPVEQPQPTIVEQKPKKKGSITPILLFIIFALGFFIVYKTRSFNKEIRELKYNTVPITTSTKEIKLDLNSTLVQTLYNKVSTNIKEDLTNPKPEQLKLYLVYRQIPESDKYESNCNLFNPTSMEPYTCDVSSSFAPKAFKKETFDLKYKEMYGEAETIQYNNIQLSNSCIVGYQYIESRGEFVEGFCNQKTATSFAVTKTLKSAVSYKNTIILTEDVYYKASEGQNLPAYLKSGTYSYKFRLDMNYNYIFLGKTYETKY